jgi:uncharacterized membrane protein YqhA
MNEEKEFAFEKKLRPLPRWIFMSRWLQAPLYILDSLLRKAFMSGSFGWNSRI